MALSLALLSIHCSSSREPEGALDFLTELSDALCEQAIRCETEWRGLGLSERCHPASRDALLDAWTPHLDVTVDRARARRCLEVFESGCDLFAVGCTRPVIVGRGERDAPCANSSLGTTCASGLFCDPLACSTCQPRRAIGESCGGSGQCEEGARCGDVREATTVMVCVPSARRGDPCPEPTRCVSGLDEPPVSCRDGFCRTALSIPLGGACDGFDRCDDEGVCVEGTCVPPADVGESCVSIACAESAVCVEGTCREPERRDESRCSNSTHCPPQSPHCVDGRCGMDPAGTPCQDDGPCGEGFFCDLSLRECAQIVPVGGECSNRRLLCARGARCEDGTCRAIASPGSACDGDETVCPWGFECAEGRCVALPIEGEACRDECAAGVCEAGRCRPRRTGEACRHLQPWLGRECEGQCVVGRCAEPLTEGAFCASAAWCPAGLTCIDSRCSTATCG